MSSPPVPPFNIDTFSINVPLWIITGVATAFVVCRVISRAFISKPALFGWDDGLVITSMVFCIVGAALLSASITAGTHVDLANPAATLPLPFVLDIAANTTYILSIPLPKIAVAILLIRIFRPSKVAQFLIMGGCILVLLIAIAEYFMNWFQCKPVAAQWDPFTHPNPVCWNGNVTGFAAYTLGALSAFQDLCLAIYPAFRIKQLQLPYKKKVGLSILMGLGVIACIFAIVKTTQLANIQGNPDNPAGLFNVSLLTGLWSAIENDVVIIVACAPTVNPFVRWGREQTSRSWSMVTLILSRSRSNTSLRATSEDATREKSDADVQLTRTSEATVPKSSLRSESYPSLPDRMV